MKLVARLTKTHMDTRGLIYATENTAHNICCIRLDIGALFDFSQKLCSLTRNDKQ